MRLACLPLMPFEEVLNRLIQRGKATPSEARTYVIVQAGDEPWHGAYYRDRITAEMIERSMARLGIKLSQPSQRTLADEAY